MTDRYQVYTKVLKALKGMIQMLHSGHLIALAMLITGIVVRPQCTVVYGECRDSDKGERQEQ